MILHLVRHSPHGDSRFASCLRSLGTNQALVLLEEAVYALLPGTPAQHSLSLLPANVRLYALESDLAGRGLALDDLPARVSVIDYCGLVDLCVSYDKVVSW